MSFFVLSSLFLSATNSTARRKCCETLTFQLMCAMVPVLAAAGPEAARCSQHYDQGRLGACVEAGEGPGQLEPLLQGPMIVKVMHILGWFTQSTT
jgi:hypothetical protein